MIVEIAVPTLALTITVLVLPGSLMGAAIDRGCSLVSRTCSRVCVYGARLEIGCLQVIDEKVPTVVEGVCLDAQVEVLDPAPVCEVPQTTFGPEGPTRTSVQAR